MAFDKGLKWRLRKLTQCNQHGRARVLIAKEINSDLEKDFRKINKLHDELGFLPTELAHKRFQLEMKLKDEVKLKNPKEFEDVWRCI